MSLEYLDFLNYEQRQAVKYNEGPLFIVAGAGTGKTMAITSKVAYLLEKGVLPQNILTLTFTNKAAKEMRERIIDMVGPSAHMAQISTFHAFGLKFLRQHIRILENGLDEVFTVVDDEDSKKLIKESIIELDIDEKIFPSNEVYNMVSSLKVGYERFYVNNNDLNSLLNRYQEKLRENNLVDFDDLILYTLEILKTEGSIRKHYQDLYKYILVDEFQDTDHLQYQIIKLLSTPNKMVCAVGDPDQSIYSFRGARYDNNREFVSDFNAKVITLSKNYRSTNAILKIANTLITKNNYRYPSYDDKFLVSDLGEGVKPVFRRFQRDHDEVFYIIEKIKELKSFYNYKPNEIAILYRSNYLSRILEENFVRNQIPYVIYGGLSFFQRREVKDILAYIRVGYNQKYDFFLKRIINVPKRKIGDTTVGKLEDHAKKSNLPIFDAIPSFIIGGQTKNELENFYNMIIVFKEAIDQDIALSELIDLVMNRSGYKEMLIAEGEEGQNRFENILELKAIFKRGEFLYEGTTREKLAQILDEISLMTDVDKNVSTFDKVILSTYHQVKGLEFKAVFMIALEENIFPNPNNADTESAMEEERRVAYVGITRAQKHLFLTCATQRYRFGRPEFNQPSRFYTEASENQGYARTTKNNEEVIFFKVGDKVSHTVFGKGTIIAIENDVATIAFGVEHGIKKLVLGHPALSKI